MANLSTSADILDYMLFRAGEPTNGTSDYEAQALIHLNRAYRALWMGGGELVPSMNEPWLWLKKDPPGNLILEPVRTTGTVSVTNNSATATLSATVSTDLDGWFFKVDDSPDVFRVSAHTSGSATLTLDSVYTGTTDTAATYRLMKLEYSLAADCLRVIAPMRVRSSQYEIDGVDLMALEQAYPLHLTEAGVPEMFAMVGETKVRFNRYGGQSSTELIRAEYDYLAKPSDLADNSSEPAIPLQHRQVLADYALFLLLTDKSDNKAEGVGLQAQAGCKAMAADNRSRFSQMSRKVGVIQPRLGGRRASRTLRTESGLIIG